MLVFLDKYGVAMRAKWCIHLVVICCICLITSFSSLQAHSPDLPESCVTELSGGDNPGSMFAVNGYSFRGEFLVITYTIQYPGMTKVKLFDGSRQLLWRSQYVNDEEGEHRLFLRRKNLAAGNYVFEFDYKNQKKTVEVSI